LHADEHLSQIPRHGPVHANGGLGELAPSGRHWSHDLLCPRLAQTAGSDCLFTAQDSLEIGRGSCADAFSRTICLGSLAATLVQFICSLFVTAGLFTRINALLLSGVLGVAILQNLLASRDPQLAILYVLTVITMVFLGGGRFSCDAGLFSREHSLVQKIAPKSHVLTLLSIADDLED